jgi:hypothetical protein
MREAAGFAQQVPDGIRPRDHFEAGLTTIRLFLDLSRDEFTAQLREQLGRTLGITRARQDPDGICEAFADDDNTPESRIVP